MRTFHGVSVYRLLWDSNLGISRAVSRLLYRGLFLISDMHLCFLLSSFSTIEAPHLSLTIPVGTLWSEVS